MKLKRNTGDASAGKLNEVEPDIDWNDFVDQPAQPLNEKDVLTFFEIDDDINKIKCDSKKCVEMCMHVIFS